MTFISRVRHWLSFLPLFALLGVTYWLNQQVLPEPFRPDGKKRHDPDAIVENFSAVKLDESGAPRFIVAAKKMMHYPDDDSTTLELPRISMLSSVHPAIHAVAKRGTISRKGDEIFLLDGIEVVREASAQQDTLTLQTEYLHIVPDQSLTSTNRAITILDAHNTLHAVGMEMDTKARTLKLLSQVRSEYVPASK
jgi:lipopolysaccharide export system protein LptC